MNNTVNLIVNDLKLIKHPEGGYYRKLYRSDEYIEQSCLPHRFSGNRSFCTSIYYLLESGDYSAWHKIQSDELWHFYKGSPLAIHMIDEKGYYSMMKIDGDKNFFAAVPKNTWFAASVPDDSSYSLVGCTVSPGFDFSDFQIAKQEELLKLSPLNGEIIKKYIKVK